MVTMIEVFFLYWTCKILCGCANSRSFFKYAG